MNWYKRTLSAFLAVLFFFGPEWPAFLNTLYAQPTSVNPPRTSVALKPLVEDLMAVTTDTTDTDQDGLPDSVEAVIGTDPNNLDSDFDRLSDLWEIDQDLDPMEPDSNFDGMPDYLEVTDVPSPDIDGDGIENGWDYDNDGDRVNDTADLSPSASTGCHDQFHFEIATDGHPVFITLQIVPENPDYLKLFSRAWDWPDGDHEGSVQDWDNSKDDVKVFPILQMTVNVPPDPNEVQLNGIDVDGNTVSIPLLPVSDHGNIAAFAGRMPYPSVSPPMLTLDARLIWKVVGKNDPDSTTLGKDALLAIYSDRFSITGMTVEQSEGTEAGVFTSPDLNQTVAANLLLAYEFLRNSANHAADAAGILNTHNISVNSHVASFAHRDGALVSIANEMIPQALDSLPADANLPVLILLEDKSVSLELSEFLPAGGPDNHFSLDLTAEPVTTIKTLKTGWYHTTYKQALQTGEIMAEIKRLGQSQTTTYSLMTLMLYWTAGEQVFEGPDSIPTDPGEDFELIPDVVEDIIGVGLSGLEGLYRAGIGLAGLRSYQSIKLLQSKGWTIAMGATEIPDLAKLGDFGKFKQWIRQCERIQDKTGFFKKMDKVLEGLDIAALFIDAGFSVYSIVAISQMSDISGIALYNGVMQVTLEYFYSCMLFLIGAIPYVGWLIAISIELSDVFGDWTDDFIAWIIDGISNVDYVVTPDIEIVGDPTITVDDKDMNGTDVGDRIEYRGRLKGIISGSANRWRLVRLSEMYPYYKIYAPAGSASVTGIPYQYNVFIDWETVSIPITTPQVTSDQNAAWRAREYESGVWIEPGTGMPNFPVYIELNSVYELWYAWSWYSFNIFDWGWQHEESYQAGQSVLGGFTLYCDVMPATMDDFVRWRSIGCLDHDGDGLWDSRETRSDPWRYDTDSDGLNDGFEIDNGLNPSAHDTDGDALVDWFEVQFGTDPKNPDTDGDGITDYLEIAGWLIEFAYEGRTFVTRVYSDPAIPDTDSDGVEDTLEYWSGLNPRSKDTNGDGVRDTARPQIPEDTVEFVKKVDFDITMSGNIEDIAVDDGGSVYALIRQYTLNFSEVRKFDTDLNEISSWFYPEDEQLFGLDRGMLIDNEHQLLHISHVYDPIPQQDVRSNIFTLSLMDGSQVGGYWATRDEIEGPWNLALERDPNGRIYVGRSGNWIHWDDYSWGIHSFVDIYDANRNHIDSWGDYAWNAEIDKLAYIQDIAYNPVNGLLYIADLGMDLNKVFIGPRFRPDRIAVFTPDGLYLQDMPGYHKDGVDFDYEYLSSVDIDSDGFVYICDAGNYRIHKLDLNGMPILSWGGQGPGDGLFELGPAKAVVDLQKNVFVLEPSEVEGDPLEHIHKFRQGVADVNDLPVVVDDNPDRDGDGLLNEVETDGWSITFTDPNGTQTLSTGSDPLMTDTDLDGLTDDQEHGMGTNPRDPDTDKDGVSDFAELQAQTNPCVYDTDGDGLSDGTEIAFGSNPNVPDTDGEGLSDREEFEQGSDPDRADTDGDGLDDAAEKDLGTNPFSPDTDGDFMFDGREVNLGTDPNNSDTDQDGLPDGIESSVYQTNPTEKDSDGDGLEDGTEVEMRLNPISEDTDKDGVPDGTELENGTNPWNSDSDHDGIPDGLDDSENLPPDTSNACPSPEFLWPPNNQFVPITITGVTDPNDDPVQIAIVKVTCDEAPSPGPGRSHKGTPDAYISQDGILYLRAERDGRGNGRVYEISFIAGDNKGGLSQGKVQVKVPHSQNKTLESCIDDGQQYEIPFLLPVPKYNFLQKTKKPFFGHNFP